MKKLLFLILIATSVCAQAGGSSTVKHNLNVNIKPESSEIFVADKISLTNAKAGDAVVFSLNSNLKITSIKNAVIKQTKKSYAEDLGMDRENTTEEFNKLKVTVYSVKLTSGNSFELTYGGKIKSPIKQSAENYQRGFSQSPGIISSKGVFLGGSTYWVPTIGEDFFSFKLKVTLPPGWKSVSQGSRIETLNRTGSNTDVWEEKNPQEEIFLIAAKFFEYKYPAGKVLVYAFLRSKDDALANKYLEATAQYLDMYKRLLGDYPYAKFALVENFWETGYGMPSFTLLGEKIIRFPFIIVSSYPHELLHNYWGNSVYVDFNSGNWCEGITAYMADCLLKEQRGQGADYRKGALQRFTDYVNSQNDFPLKKFHSRYDQPSEAIGYGKSLMLWHMLRIMVGDENFVKSFRLFYNTNKFRRASFDDIRKAFEKITGKNLKWFFNQWVNRKGAPLIVLGNTEIKKNKSGYLLRFSLLQKQKEKAFKVNIPVYVQTEKGIVKKDFMTTKKAEQFDFPLNSKPLKLLVDPEFDAFRRLSDKEIAPSLSAAYGKKITTFVLPEKSSSYYSYYKQFVKKWIETHRKEKFVIANQEDFNFKKFKGSIWVLGLKNKGLHYLNNQLKDYSSFIGADSVRLGGAAFPYKNNSFVLTVKNKLKNRGVVVFLKIGDGAAVNGLVIKLPHYGKYSYLAFEGNEPTNIAKGQWVTNSSPMVRSFSKIKKRIKLPTRKALVYLRPVFSIRNMYEHIKYLASDKLKGRGLGSPELNKAANYIANKFKEYGLIPGGENKSYFQSWTSEVEGKKGKIVFKNVIGVIAGNDAKLKNECVVISAHYDHLGLGWPDVHKGDEGKIHHGADDNASGVSVMLELARVLSKSFKPSRSILFVAFTGEEEGLLGSKYFVNNYTRFPADKIFADLNLDTVGRLFDKPLLILDASSAKEWRYIFMGTTYVTGVKTRVVNKPLDSSDQISFINKGIPAVQLFSGANQDYHRPTDTFDKIDKRGLAKVASVVKEAVEYLTERKTPLSFKGTKINNHINAPENKGSRRVSTGSIPDFTYDGTGVKLSGVVENSPAEKAGLKKGDVIISFDGKKVAGLRDYSNLLKKHKPGDIVKIKFKRNGKILETKIKLKAR